MNYPDSLRRFRKEYKITQKQVAAAVNIHERLYQSYEYGKVIPSVTTMMQIADFFDVSLDYLVGRCDNPDSHKQ